MIVFGPVPSRRLGRSLGINNIPPKICTYSCAYCQLGRTVRMQIERGSFYEPRNVLALVREKVERAGEAGEPIDYLTFVPDGEPTLDLGLGRAIDMLRPLGIRIAVITNASLVGRRDVRDALARADWVSLKVDSTREGVWRAANRPHGSLQLPAILDGALEFARSFGGTLVTETMLVEGLNDSADLVGELAAYLGHLQPSIAYLSIPTRPPAEPWVISPGEKAITRAYQILGREIDRVETLIGYEGNAFAFTGNVLEDLLSITSVHPMREDAVSQYLSRAGSDWSTIHGLIAQDRLVETEYGGHRFYLRRIHR